MLCRLSMCVCLCMCICIHIQYMEKGIMNPVFVINFLLSKNAKITDGN